MVKNFKLFKLKYAFILSIIISFINWFLFYTLLPVNTSPLTSETIWFIILSVVSLCCGFYAFKGNSKKSVQFQSSKLFLMVCLLAFVGVTFRYIDLFGFREITFSNPYFKNKILSNANSSKSGLLIALLSSLRVLYILPILYLIVKKSKQKIFWCFAILLIAFSSVEIFLFGTRKPFFYLMIIIVIALFYFNKEQFKKSKKTVLYIFSSIVLLGVFSFLILNKRMKENNFVKDDVLIKVVYSRYNDFVKIKSEKLKELKANPNSNSTKAQIMFIHTGQYIIHGFYELNYIVKNDFPKALGVYSFNPIFKLTNRLGITNKELTTLKSHPRDFVYTSFYGSLFIDFGWFTLIPMFLFGLFQRWVYNKIHSNVIASVFFVVLISVNLLMPIFNILSGSGLYLFLFLTLLLIISDKKMEITEVDNK